MASKLCIQKDWVIVVAQSLAQNAQEAHPSNEQELISDAERDKADSARLASINATVRRYDLITSILAPLVTQLPSVFRISLIIWTFFRCLRFNKNEIVHRLDHGQCELVVARERRCGERSAPRRLECRLVLRRVRSARKHLLARAGVDATKEDRHR